MHELVKEGLQLWIIHIAVFPSRKFYLPQISCFLASLKTMSVFHSLVFAATAAAATTTSVIMRFAIRLYNLIAQVREFI